MLLKISLGCIHWDFIFLALEPPINAHHKREPFEIDFLPWGKKNNRGGVPLVNRSIALYVWCVVCTTTNPQSTTTVYRGALPRVHCPLSSPPGWLARNPRFRGMREAPKIQNSDMRRSKIQNSQNTEEQNTEFAEYG